LVLTFPKATYPINCTLMSFLLPIISKNAMAANDVYLAEENNICAFVELGNRVLQKLACHVEREDLQKSRFWWLQVLGNGKVVKQSVGVELLVPVLVSGTWVEAKRTGPGHPPAAGRLASTRVSSKSPFCFLPPASRSAGSAGLPSAFSFVGRGSEFVCRSRSVRTCCPGPAGICFINSIASQLDLSCFYSASFLFTLLLSLLSLSLALLSAFGAPLHVFLFFILVSLVL